MTERRTRDQLLQELAGLRQRVAELEASEARRKQAERELSIVYDALDSAPGGVVIADLDGRITYVNPAFLRMFEYGDRAQVLGKTAADLFAAAEIRGFADIKTVIDETRGETEEFAAQRKDGTAFPVEVSLSSVTDNKGQDRRQNGLCRRYHRAQRDGGAVGASREVGRARTVDGGHRSRTAESSSFGPGGDGIAGRVSGGT